MADSVNKLRLSPNLIDYDVANLMTHHLLLSLPGPGLEPHTPRGDYSLVTQQNLQNVSPQS